MRIENYIDLNDKLGVSGLFFAVGSFGVVDGKARYERKDEGEKTTFVYTDGKVRLVAEFEAQKNGVVVRRDRFYNVGAETTEIYSLLSRFSLTGNEYEVYTQYSGWQHESLGDWQRLLTQITSASEGIRTCDGAAPVMAFHDLYTERNTVMIINNRDRIVTKIRWLLRCRITTVLLFSIEIELFLFWFLFPLFPMVLPPDSAV